MTTGGLSWRRLGVLITGLPRDCLTARSVVGDDVEWGYTEHLLAAGVDALHVANWQRGGGKGRRPRRVPRPGIGSRGKRMGNVEQRSREEVVAYLDQFRPKHEEDEPSPLN